MLWLSIALHAVPFAILSRNVSPDVVQALPRTFNVFLQPAPLPPSPLPEVIRKSTKLVVPTPKTNEPSKVVPSLSPIADPQAPPQEKARAPESLSTRAQTPVADEAEHYLTSDQVDQPADLLAPMEASLFADDFTLTGTLTVQIGVNARGGVDTFEILEAVGDESGRLRERMTTWFKDKKFNPARKGGKPVASVFRFSFNIERLDEPFKDVPVWPPPGYRPPLDAKGNAVWPAAPPIVKPAQTRPR
jgi:hypothetical protein